MALATLVHYPYFSSVDPDRVAISTGHRRMRLDFNAARHVSHNTRFTKRAQGSQLEANRPRDSLLAAAEEGGVDDGVIQDEGRAGDAVAGETNVDAKAGRLKAGAAGFARAVQQAEG